MALSLAQSIKTQILIALNTLQTNGIINTIVSLDESPNPLSKVPDTGYPMAYIALPRVENDFEDQATNLRTYRYDILFVVDPNSQNFDKDTGIEGLIDAAVNELDSVYTLAGAALAASLPATVDALPVSTGDKTLLCFVVTLRARTIYQVGT